MMKNLALAAVALAVLSSATGCAVDADAGRSETPSTSAGDGTRATKPEAPRDEPVPPSTTAEYSIRNVKAPGSSIADGARVRIAGPGVRVTAAWRRALFVQEAGDDGGCETSTTIVAYRAIEVALADDPPAELVRGSRVVVEGLVTARDGRRTIENATLTVLDEPAREYLPHCDRASDAFHDYALDAVLVMTAGTTDGAFEVSPEDGSWLLATCFGDAVRVGARMASYEERSPTWHWVSGVVVHTAAETRLEPRDRQDISCHGHDDACL